MIDKQSHSRQTENNNNIKHIVKIEIQVLIFLYDLHEWFGDKQMIILNREFSICINKGNFGIDSVGVVDLEKLRRIIRLEVEIHKFCFTQPMAIPLLQNRRSAHSIWIEFTW